MFQLAAGALVLMFGLLSIHSLLILWLLHQEPVDISEFNLEIQE